MDVHGRLRSGDLLAPVLRRGHEVNPDEVLWKVKVMYRDGTANTYRRQTHKEALRWEKRGLKDRDVSSVSVKMEGR